MNNNPTETRIDAIAFNCGYYTHNINMRKDNRLLALRKRFRLTGMAVWYMLLENLENVDGQCVLRFDAVARECLAADFGIKEERLAQIVEYCERLGLLAREGDCFTVCCDGFYVVKVTGELAVGGNQPCDKYNNGDIVDVGGGVNYCNLTAVNDGAKSDADTKVASEAGGKVVSHWCYDASGQLVSQGFTPVDNNKTPAKNHHPTTPSTQ